MQFPLLALFPLLAAFAAAAPAALEERAATTCGGRSYSAAQVSAASQQACDYYQSGKKANNYPHTYNNYEGFNFRVAGPYQEFPIKTSGLYTGGSPGADRVIINTNCEEAGAITHTGAKGNNFVGCSGTS
ncbi:Guanyl-specific ribonuclease F1 [Apiospora kogelbergensis]|uniref:ribonuclease T1 n=1 Tax=Apiospora kogelbergensis TaxID=1337665 RepID=A0AAW0R0H2_9PEZI